jgi:very-short-patch-repair endonuclease
MKHLPYNKNLKMFSRELRNFSTRSEVLLWNELKAGKVRGYKFNRQKPLLNYIVDFYCKKLSLVIEVDGITHTYEGAYDRDVKRQKELEGIGLAFLRFDDLDVKEKMSSVLKTIERFIEEFEKTHPPGPLQRGNGVE